MSIYFNIIGIRKYVIKKVICLILRERRLRWFGHVACLSGAIRTAYDMQINGKLGAGRPKQNMEETDRERLP